MIAGLLAVLTATCLVAAFLGWRSGNDARDVKLMVGMGSVLGVASLGAL